MPVRLRPEQQILEDIAKFRAIARKLDDVGDVPTRRTKPTKRRSASSKKRNSITKPRANNTAASQKNNAFEALKKKIFEQKPSYMGRKAVLRLSQTGTEKGESAPDKCATKDKEPSLKRTVALPKVSSLQSQAKTFEQNVLVRRSYDEMVNAVRENADDIDFGLSWKILPKNLEGEKTRFHIEYEADHLMLHQSGSLLSGDIDYYFRQLGQTFSEANARSVPLV